MRHTKERVGIWNFIAGYVIIEIKGASLEKLVNSALNNGIDILCVRRSAADAVTAKISVAGFYKLHRLARSGRYRIKIIEKHGTIIALSRFRFRKILLLGWTAVLLVLFTISRFVWFIDVSGCDKISENEIVELLDGFGVDIGIKRSDVMTYALSNDIMLADERIAFASVKLEGVILRVEITEAAQKIETLKDGEPSSIYAKKDGIITEVTALSGKPVVQAGDAVFAGEELISGILKNDENGLFMSESRGTVMANVTYVFSADVGPTISVRVRTGAKTVRYAPSLFGFTLKTHLGEYDDFETEKTGLCQMKNCFLPLEIFMLTDFETENRERKGTFEELIDAARTEAEESAREGVEKTARILSKQTEWKKLDDGSVRVTITILARENIGVSRSIDG